MSEPTGKTCRRCRVVLTGSNSYPFELRHRNYVCIPCKLAETRSYKHGRQSIIDCANRWAAAHPERVAAFRKKAFAAYMANPANDIKIKSRHKFQYAIKRGVIVRPTACEMCGGNRNIQGHHADYTKPLDVRWLCQKCHYWEHRKINDKAG